MFTFPLFAACGASLPGVMSDHLLPSDFVDQTFALSVFESDALPSDPSVVFVLDGDDWTDRVADIVSDQHEAGLLGAPPLVVGIGYGDTPNARGRDYTPPGDAIPTGHGEVEAFYRFLTLELVPWVNEGWGPVPAEERVVIGHSFGGIAALWGMLHQRDQLGGFVALSPSLTFAEGALFDREADYAAMNDDLDVSLYLAAGSQEAYGLAGLTEVFGEVLEDRTYPSLRLQTKLHRGKSHATVYPEAADAGLAFVLGGG